MKFSEVKDLSTGELRKKQKTLQEELFQLRMKNSLGQVSNPLLIRQARRDIARLMTAIASKTKN